jgi:hypothetical protein
MNQTSPDLRAIQQRKSLAGWYSFLAMIALGAGAVFVIAGGYLVGMQDAARQSASPSE